jgi:hypothetical protein
MMGPMSAETESPRAPLTDSLSVGQIYLLDNPLLGEPQRYER